MIKSWVERRTEELLGYQDDVISGFVISQLEPTDIDDKVCPKHMQIQLTGKCLYSHFKVSWKKMLQYS